DQRLYALPGICCKNRFVLTPIDCPFVANCAGVGYIRQQALERVLGEWATPPKLALLAGPALQGPATALDFSQGPGQRPILRKQRKDGAHAFGLRQIDDEFSATCGNVITQHRAAAQPFPFPSGCRDLVACSLPAQFLLELRK